MEPVKNMCMNSMVGVLNRAHKDFELGMGNANKLNVGLDFIGLILNVWNANHSPLCSIASILVDMD